MFEAQEAIDNKAPSVTSLNVRSVKAVEVLREVMHFHNDQAKDIMLEIIVKLKNDPKARGDLLAMMYKKYAESIDIVIDCASKLAPYEAPKLQSLEVKNEVTHRFVLRAPETASDTKTWLTQVGAPKQIEDIKYEEAYNDDSYDGAGTL